MKQYKGFLIDLDGTIYRGIEKIDEAVQFVKELDRRKIPYLFVTNNSTKRPDQVAEFLRLMGVPVTEEHIFTSSMATASYITDLKEQASIYVIGEEGLQHSLVHEGHKLVEDEAEYVVIGLDRALTYEKLAKASLQVRQGATFIATNGDAALPTERGLMPGNGSIVSVVSVSTGVQPTFIGKPESIIIEQALEVIGTAKEETIMVGDNYHTDILAGIHGGIDTLMVYTGVSTRDQVGSYHEKPTYELNSLGEWMFE
ncbi:TIGR01457 family HAD-type hydrolase [bacterium LRH843]|nr:TIGR01457 family HAD-type hydrolase [bacterium LRH843]